MIAWGAAVYDVLVRLYPFEFRRTFSEELQDDFMVASCEASDAGGAAALCGFWARAFADFVVSLVREWLRTPWVPILLLAAAVSVTVFMFTALTVSSLPVRFPVRPPGERNGEALKLIVVMTVGVLIPICGTILGSLWMFAFRRRTASRRRGPHV